MRHIKIHYDKVNQEKKLECTVCSLTFMWPYSLRNHFERKHGAVKLKTTSGFGLFEKSSNENIESNSKEKFH